MHSTRLATRCRPCHRPDWPVPAAGRGGGRRTSTVDVGDRLNVDAVAAQPRRGGIVKPVNQADGVLPGVGNGSVGGISAAAGRVINEIYPRGVVTGVAVAGEATGDTLASYVIYVSPPVLGQHEDPFAALYAAYQNGLLLADAHRLETVAIQLPVAELGVGSQSLVDLSQAIARDVFAQTDTHHVRTVILVTADASITEPIGRVDDPPAPAEVTTAPPEATADTVKDAAPPVGGVVAQGIDNGVQGQPAAPGPQDTSPSPATPFLPTVAPTLAPQPRIGDDEDEDEDGDGEAAALGLAEIGATGTGTSDESRGVTMYDYYPSTEQLTKLIEAGFGLHFVPPTLGAGSELESFLQAILDAYPDLVGSVLFLDLPVVQADLTDLAARRELVARLWQTLAGRAGVLPGELDVRSAAALLGVTIIDSDATVLAPDASRAGPVVGGDGRYVVQVRPEGKPAVHFHAASRSGSRQTQDDQTLQALLTAMGPTLPVIEKLRSVLATLRAEALWDATVNTTLRDVLARAELGDQARVELGAQAQRTLAAVELATMTMGGPLRGGPHRPGRDRVGRIFADESAHRGGRTRATRRH